MFFLSSANYLKNAIIFFFFALVFAICTVRFHLCSFPLYSASVCPTINFSSPFFSFAWNISTSFCCITHTQTVLKFTFCVQKWVRWRLIGENILFLLFYLVSKSVLVTNLLCLAIGIFHFVVCTKYEAKLGLLIASPMVFELMLLSEYYCKSFK